MQPSVDKKTNLEEMYKIFEVNLIFSRLEEAENLRRVLRYLEGEDRISSPVPETVDQMQFRYRNLSTDTK